MSHQAVDAAGSHHRLQAEDGCCGVSFATFIPPDKLSTSCSVEAAQPEQSVAEEVSGKGDNAQTRESEPSDEIRAMLWKVEDYQHFWEIRQYETSAYRGHWCHIHVEGVDSDSEEDLIPKDGAAFVWAKDPQSPGLKEGVFDLQKLQKTHKASISIRVKYMSCTGRSNGMKVDRRDS